MVVFEQLAKSQRLWMPYHVGVEYHSRRAGVVCREAKQPYEAARSKVKELESCATQLERLAPHAFLDRSNLAKMVRDCAAALRESIDSSEAAHPDYLAGDPIQNQLAHLFDGCVGADDIDADKASFVKEADRRYAKHIPPGFEDAQKSDNKYGDLIIWTQMKTYAKSEDKDILFVTNDSKSDWWTKTGSEKLRPHVALRREFWAETGRNFYAYSGDDFLKYAKDHLITAVKDASIAEVRERREMGAREEEVTEAQQRALADLSAAEQAALIQAAYDEQIEGIPALRRAIETFGKAETTRASLDSSMLRIAMEEASRREALLRPIREAALRRAQETESLLRPIREAALRRAQETESLLRAARTAALRREMTDACRDIEPPTVERDPGSEPIDTDPPDDPKSTDANAEPSGE